MKQEKPKAYKVTQTKAISVNICARNEDEAIQHAIDGSLFNKKPVETIKAVLIKND